MLSKSFYTELSPSKREAIIEVEPPSSEKDRALELFCLRHQNSKKGHKDLTQDRYLWLLLMLQTDAERRPLFTSQESKRIRRQLQELKAGTTAEKNDSAFYQEMLNSARRFFATSSYGGWGRKLFSFGQSDEEIKEHDRLKRAWGLIYGAPYYLGLEEDLKPISHAVREAFLMEDRNGEQKLLRYDKQMRPEVYAPKS